MGKIAQKTAVVYCRTSTKGQKDAATIEAQIEFCKRTIEAHGLKVIPYGPKKDGWLRDDGISGSLLEGRSFAKLIDDLEHGRIASPDYLVTYSMSRLARHAKDGDMSKLVRSATDKARIMAVLNGARVMIIDTDGVNDPASVLTEIKETLSGEEYRSIRKRTMDGKARVLSEGKWATGGRVPWGYLRAFVNGKDKKQGTVPEPHPEDGPKFLQLMRWYVEGGASFAANKAGAAKWIAPRGGASWYPSTVQQLLNRIDEYRGGEKLLSIRGTSYPVKLPPLLDASLYREVKARMKERTKQRRTKLLSSFFTDCACGDHVRGSASTKTGHYYMRCRNKCGGVRDDVLDPKLWELTIARLIQIKEHESVISNGKDPYGPQLATAKARLKSIEAKMDKLLDLNLDGTIDKETFTRRSEPLRAEKLQAKDDVGRLEREREAHAQRKHGIETVHSRVQAMLKTIKNGRPDVEAKRAILKNLLQGDRVVLTYPKTKGKKTLPTITLPAFGDLPPVTVRMDKDVTEQLHGVSRDVLDLFYDVDDAVTDVAVG